MRGRVCVPRLGGGRAQGRVQPPQPPDIHQEFR